MASLVGDANRRSQQLRVAAVASEINVGSQKTFPDGVDRLQVEQLHVLDMRRCVVEVAFAQPQVDSQRSNVAAGMETGA